MFHLRIAGIRGSIPFTPEAIAWIGAATQGLMRRTNILADKALLAAFVEGACTVDEYHVQAAIRDSELPMHYQSMNWEKLYVTTVAFLATAILLASLGWLYGDGSRLEEIKVNGESKTVAEHISFKAPAMLSLLADNPAVPLLWCLWLLQALYLPKYTPAPQSLNRRQASQLQKLKPGFSSISSFATDGYEIMENAG